MHTKAHILITLESKNAKNISRLSHGDNIHTTQVKRKKVRPKQGARRFNKTGLLSMSHDNK